MFNKREILAFGEAALYSGKSMDSRIVKTGLNLLGVLLTKLVIHSTLQSHL